MHSDDFPSSTKSNHPTSAREPKEYCSEMSRHYNTNITTLNTAVLYDMYNNGTYSHLFRGLVGPGCLEPPFVGRRPSSLLHRLLQQLPRLLLLVRGAVEPVLKLRQLSRALAAFPAPLAACCSLPRGRKGSGQRLFSRTIQMRFPTPCSSGV